MRDRTKRSTRHQAGDGFFDSLKGVLTSDFAKESIYKPLAAAAAQRASKVIAGQGMLSTLDKLRSSNSGPFALKGKGFEALLSAKRGTGRRMSKKKMLR